MSSNSPKTDLGPKNNNRYVSTLAGDGKISHPGTQKNAFCPFNVYFYSLNKAVFYLLCFVRRPKRPCNLNTYLDTFSRLSCKSCCHALNICLYLRLKKQKLHCLLLVFPISYSLVFFNKKNNFSKGSFHNFFK